MSRFKHIMPQGYAIARSLQQPVEVACWLYLAAIIGLWIIVRETGDRWWLATVFLFGPRWICLLPLLPLVVAATLACHRALWILLLTAWVILFPLMGLCLPWRLAIPHARGAPRIRSPQAPAITKEPETKPKM